MRWVSRPLFWVVVVATIAGGGYAAVRARGPSVRTARVVARDIEQHIVASGRVWVPSRVQVSAQSAGLVVAVGAVEGQRVRAGDLLVQLDDAEARAAVAQAQAAVDQAAARVEQLRRVGAIVASEALRQAQAQLEGAEKTFARTRELANSGATPPAELDDAQRALEIARAQKAAAEVQQLSSAPLGADSRVALTALLLARAQLTGANVRLAQARITALDDGVVLSRSVEPGDVVQPARTLLVMAADAATQLVFNPDERNLPFISLDQAARASADAYPQIVFDAVVSYIAPSIDPQRGSVEVRLRVPQPPAFLKPDMTVSVDLTVARAAGALTLPSEAVRGAATPEPWVWAVEGGRAARRSIALGLKGEGSVEVASGLPAGAEVIVPDGRALSDGQRVHTECD
ncbi:efflux RND transporter periplasmic adaptor subunit [Sorangium sp. So ce362]|uniref:efflux RND transporter periplasmic adaptor subunit n=1 Tax=Sorangium sp. So ce362 TaxID=3133303 RepID=UPI003F5FCAA3